jgi:hypothetical protein
MPRVQYANREDQNWEHFILYLSKMPTFGMEDARMKKERLKMEVKMEE